MFRSECKQQYDTKQGLINHRRWCLVNNADADEDDNGVDLTAKFHEACKNKQHKIHPKIAVPLPEVPAASFSNIPGDSPPDLPMQVDDIPPSGSPAPSLPMAPTPEPEATGRGHHRKRPTWKILQLLLDPPAPAPDLEITPPDDDTTPPPGPAAPTRTPDHLLRSAVTPLQLDLSSEPTTGSNPYYPFLNSTVYGITNWMWSGSPLKSIEEGIKLVNFLKLDQFNKADLKCFNLVKETERLDKSIRSGTV
ncbi:hypothetical protein B0H16DRAFT_1463848 [Mycena metata]|uniref:Uncharacterized protein n=1 Tax=Mycena metata TaxID=1033252 RepID=A0AAD7IK63_9AGAR|nr:hypothetical protein B0H16DRAFT_1463848 [Mycena metata]